MADPGALAAPVAAAGAESLLPEQRRGHVPTAAVPGWYGSALLALDATAALVGGAVGHSVRFGWAGLSLREAALSVVLLPVLWCAVLLLVRAYESRFLGVGSEEFNKVVRAGTTTLAFVATTAWVVQSDITRSYVLVAVPTTVVLSLVLRYGLRKELHRLRADGRHVQRALVVGHRQGAASTTKQMHQASYHGLRVVGACVPLDPEAEPLEVPVLGGLDDVLDVAQRHDIDVVVVLPSPEFDGAATRRLGWALEDVDVELLVAPAVTDVIGPRLAIRPVCGLPLLHVERPELSGVRRFAKSLFDRLAALGALVVLSPALLLMALLVVVDSRGPVFFKQQRIGRHGKPFTMVKFRSMVPGAERLVVDLRDGHEGHDGNGVLFKLREDPRVTRVGRLLRRTSLDELPQLFNVLAGQMSLVGPRPPLLDEVDRYESHVHRRFLVKPGLTGLWQINGRSDLDWEESVRLDLRYVENWSFAYDFMIMWKTLGAVVRGKGAY